jgi:hypothetical protein
MELMQWFVKEQIERTKTLANETNCNNDENMPAVEQVSHHDLYSIGQGALEKTPD